EARLSEEAVRSLRLRHAVREREEELARRERLLAAAEVEPFEHAERWARRQEARAHGAARDHERALVPRVDVEQRAGRGVEEAEEDRREHARLAVRARDVVV